MASNDVQVDAALEAMAETGSAAEGTNVPASFTAISPPLSKTSLSSTSASSSGSASLTAGGTKSSSALQKSGIPPPKQGYPKELAVKEVEEKFVCGFCENILRDPQQSECGHRFCNCCRLEKMRLGQPVICEACIKEEMPEEDSILNLEAMFDDKAAIREMRKIPCKCINPGCTWRGTFHEYITSHESNCDKKVLACPLCGSVMPQNRLEVHMSTQCPKRLVTCIYCQQQMMQEQEEKHQMTCPLVPVKCDRCSALVPRNEFEKHLEQDCIYRDMVCPVPDCRKKMPKAQFPSHLNEDAKTAQKHLLFLFDRLAEIERELNQVKVQPPPLAPAPHSEQGLAASAEGGAGARGQQAGVDNAQDEGQRGHGAVGGVVNAAAPEPHLSAKLKLHEDLMSVLHGEILRCIRQVEALTNRREREATTVRNLEGKLQNLERQIGTVEVRLKEVQPLRSPITNTEVGTLVEFGDTSATWCIPEFSQVRRATVNGPRDFVDSPAFTIGGSIGYKLRMRIFPDGNGAAKSKAISLYMNLVPGACDDLLPWPFEADVHFLLIDFKDFKHHKSAYTRLLKSEPSCSKPPVNGHVPSQPGFGVDSLITVGEMRTQLDRYVRDDKIYLRVVLELKQLPARLSSLDPRQWNADLRNTDRASGRK
ncbi:TNF receptor-associated factor 2 [Elysia marginata]|uniref:TNF receptor-associated factor 2 n=1 Tax=Elysia marginata TaxID=1093978 RepID=A0AAV4EXR3_9GAST|nr:TNF receptor-associated factor 2 [Elysia marginata]